MDNFTRLGKSGVVLVRRGTRSANALQGERGGREKFSHPVVSVKFILVGAAADFESAVEVLHDLRVTETGDDFCAVLARDCWLMMFHAGERSRRGRTSTGVGSRKHEPKTALKTKETMVACVIRLLFISVF